VKTKIGFVFCIPRLFPCTDTLQAVGTGKKAGEMAWQMTTFFHTHQGVFMWKESGKGWLWPPLKFQTVLLLTFGFKSHLNGITKKIVLHF